MSNVMTKKRLRYEVLEEILSSLYDKIGYMETDAKDDLEAASDPDTGEINENSWRYDSYKTKTEKIEAIKKVIAEIEKM